MALNPFEQLEFFVPEPRRTFGEIVEMILQVLDGGDWVRMLQEPSGRRALDRICSWGVVLASGAEAFRLHGRLPMRP